jgi:hypothetical protein
MRFLRAGCSGGDVTQWQQFLTGQGLLRDPVNGVFDEATVQATKDFQRSHGLKPDGVVGNMTMGQALLDGISVLTDDGAPDTGPGWPARSSDIGPLCLADRKRIFGQFGYAPAPTAACPEAIRFLDDWPKENIVTVTVPQLAGVSGASKDGRVQCHKLAAPQLVSLFRAWEDAGLIDRVKSWAGSWAPRFIRGSRSVLSNHAWATAFDINAGWNGLGMQPALKGKPGCVRELVGIALDHGWWWGGWFDRKDGMHFEVYSVR